MGILGGMFLVAGLWLLSHSLIRWKYKNEDFGHRRAEVIHIWSWNEPLNHVMEIHSIGKRDMLTTLTPSFLLPVGKTVILRVTQEAWKIMDGEGNRDPGKPGALVRVTLSKKAGPPIILDYLLNVRPDETMRGFKELAISLPAGTVSMSVSVQSMFVDRIDPAYGTFIHMVLPMNPFTILGLSLNKAGSLLVSAGSILYFIILLKIVCRNGIRLRLRHFFKLSWLRFRLSAVTFLAVFASAVGSLVLITYIPRSDIRKHIRQGYDQGMLNVNWSFQREVIEGRDTFSDAAIANFALDKNRNRLLNALSPRYSSPDGRTTWTPEQDLLEFVTDPSQMKPMDATNRYWFGHMVIAKPLLWMFNMRGVREALFSLIIFGAIASIWATERYAKSLIYVTGCLCAAIFTCAGVFLFGKSWVHAPMYLAPWFVIITGLLAYRHLKPAKYSVILPIVLGAMSNFMENATGVVLVSLSVFIVFDYFYHVNERGVQRRNALVGTLRRAMLFCAAFAGFIVSKLILLSLLLGWEPTFGTFFQAIVNRTGANESIAPWLLVESVNSAARAMVFWDAWFVPAFILTGVCGGIAILVLAMIRLSANLQVPGRSLDCVILSIPLMLTSGWYIVFSNHTLVHFSITARFVFLPIAFFFVLSIYMLKWIIEKYKS